MKATFAIVLFVAILFTACEYNKIEFNGELPDGFCIVANEKVILNHNDIEYYDYSTHLIYIKENKSFIDDIESIGDFTVYADRIQIYKGQTVPGYSSFLPSGPIIPIHPSLYGDYIIPIGMIQRIDSLGNFLPDPREDKRVVAALKKYNQFRAGLSCEIKSVQYLGSNNVKVDLILKNNGSLNYYYLDPNKMGINLFHFFTNGLFIKDFKNHKNYTHTITAVPPVPWTSWEKDWLSIINRNESKMITITYDSFEAVAPGQYKATFEYPGLCYQVEKKDLLQDNGQIWLGSLTMIKEITIE